MQNVSYHIDGMGGLGDNIYQRPFVKELTKLGQVYLGTPWPQLYSDLPVKFVKQHTALRTQLKNIALQDPQSWASAPDGAAKIKVSYAEDFQRVGIWGAFRKIFGVNPTEGIDLPINGVKKQINGKKPIAVIRPVTLRSEWDSSSRAPDPMYVRVASEILSQTHHVIAVADLEKGREWILEPDVAAHKRFYQGELSVVDLLTLVCGADIVIGGVGWVVPACLASQTDFICIGGGRGGHNHPAILCDKSLPQNNMHWLLPDKFCMCTHPKHNCNKRITNFDRKFKNLLANR